MMNLNPAVWVKATVLGAVLCVDCSSTNANSVASGGSGNGAGSSGVAGNSASGASAGGGAAPSGGGGGGIPTSAAIVASCKSSKGPYCDDFIGTAWTIAATKTSCSGSWSAAPCPTAERVGSCVIQIPTGGGDYSTDHHIYHDGRGLDGSCNACSVDVDCADTNNSTRPCVNGCCDDFPTVQDAAVQCQCAVAADPGCSPCSDDTVSPCNWRSN